MTHWTTLPLPELVEVGDTFSVALTPKRTGAYYWAMRSGATPPGVPQMGRTDSDTITGTVTGGEGTSGTARYQRVNASYQPTSPEIVWSWTVAEAAPPEPTTIPVPVPVQTDTGYVLPEAEGVTWTVDNVEQAPGEYTVTVGTEPETRTILPFPDVGYVFDTEPEPVTFTYDPPPPPEPEDPPMDATLPVTTIPLGQEVEVTLSPLFSLTDTRFVISGDLPPGLTATPMKTGADTIAGTPTEAGSWDLGLQGRDDGGDYTDTTHTLTLAVTDPDAPEVIPAPAAERTEDGYMLPEVEGVIWTVDGVEKVPGSYSVEPVTETTTVTILPTADVGYVFDTEPEPLVLVFEPEPEPDPDPEPEPEPDPEPGPEPVGPFTPTPAPDEPDEVTEAAWARLMDDDPQAVYVATKLAERIVKHTGQDVADLDPAEVLTARDHAMTVLEYVRGYVRDRGFIGYVPHRSLQAVIVSAGARLFINPEQLTYYSTGDYSERPATLTGWTAAELGVLRRFRRTYR